jgi:hypothetical protein
MFNDLRDSDSNLDRCWQWVLGGKVRSDYDF